MRATGRSSCPSLASAHLFRLSLSSLRRRRGALARALRPPPHPDPRRHTFHDTPIPDPTSPFPALQRHTRGGMSQRLHARVATSVSLCFSEGNPDVGFGVSYPRSCAYVASLVSRRAATLCTSPEEAGEVSRGNRGRSGVTGGKDAVLDDHQVRNGTHPRDHARRRCGTDGCGTLDYGRKIAIGEVLDRGSTAQRAKRSKTNLRFDGARACLSKVPGWTCGAPALENWNRCRRHRGPTPRRRTLLGKDWRTRGRNGTLYCYRDLATDRS